MTPQESDWAPIGSKGNEQPVAIILPVRFASSVELRLDSHPGNVGGAMYLAKVYEPGATAHRIRYAISNILRDRVVNDGAFRVCFEMEDEDVVIRAILLRGLRSPRLRAALERSHLIDLTHWLARYPSISEAYIADPAEIRNGPAARARQTATRLR